MTMSGQNVRVWKEMILALLMVLSNNFSGKTEENHEEQMSG
jgi:hypothetical protein